MFKTFNPGVPNMTKKQIESMSRVVINYQNNYQWTHLHFIECDG